MIRLSFIVPFYNVESYIEQCIRSLYDQDIPQEEYEVICVDDCSPDGSRAIVERLQKEYPTLRLICHTENKRQGGARNTGLDVAKGQYIWFVDSDDYIEANCLGRLLRLAEEEHLDILDFDFDSDWLKQTFRKNAESFDMGPCTGTEYVFDESHGGRWSWRCSSVCGEIFKRELINKLRFREKVQQEDNDFALLLFAMAKQVHHIVDKPYYYRVVENSTVHRSPNFLQLDYHVELMATYLKLLRECNEKGLSSIWRMAIGELLKYETSIVIKLIEETSEEDRIRFFHKKYPCMGELKKYISIRSWLRLQSNVLYNTLRRL